MITAADDGWEAVRRRVVTRDGGCLAAQRGAEGGCRTRQFIPHSWNALGFLELDHVKEQPKIGAPIVKRKDKHSYKAPDDEAHLVAMCGSHHETWATANRDVEREHLRKHYPEVWGA